KKISVKWRTSRKKTVAVENIKESPKVKRICNTTIGKKFSQDHATGTLKNNHDIGKKITNANKNCAKLNRTVVIGNTSIGRATFLIKLPLSRMDPVDIISDWAKKFHGRIPTIKKYAKFAGPP